MDEVRNPFTPGAGSQPPELAGRKVFNQFKTSSFATWVYYDGYDSRWLRRMWTIVQSARKADILTFRSMQMSQNINGLDIMILLDRLDCLSLSVQSKCEEIAAILSEKTEELAS